MSSRAQRAGDCGKLLTSQPVGCSILSIPTGRVIFQIILVLILNHHPIEKVTEAKQWSDLHTDQLSQAVFLRFAESGRLAGHRTRMLEVRDNTVNQR